MPTVALSAPHIVLNVTGDEHSLCSVVLLKNTLITQQYLSMSVDVSQNSIEN